MTLFVGMLVGVSWPSDILKLNIYSGGARNFPTEGLCFPMGGGLYLFSWLGPLK